MDLHPPDALAELVDGIKPGVEGCGGSRGMKFERHVTKPFYNV